MIDVHDLEREVRRAASADALLLAIETVPAGAVVGNVTKIGSDRRGDQRIHLSPEWAAILGNPVIDQLDCEFRQINADPLALQAVSGD